MSNKTRYRKATRIIGIISIVIALVNLFYHMFTSKTLSTAIVLLFCAIIISAGAYRQNKKSKEKSD